MKDLYSPLQQDAPSTLSPLTVFCLDRPVRLVLSMMTTGECVLLVVTFVALDTRFSGYSQSSS